ncbi:MAG: 3-hydroxybutyryl-CoA dehydrogenase [Chitinophagaceae bacterium]|jgi:3-hydroxybutyryl-CoA dehydrogenase|nr:3-hydroxybutyryl-CoA dehydrogenase [Chitinophagaceae bacterium]
MTQKINTICVCGAGTMGSGIAQVCATAGYKTILYELNEAVLEKAKASIDKGLKFLLSKNKISAEQKQTIESQIVFTNNFTDCIADLYIEAIIENPEIKIKLFNQLSANNQQAIFATNTSSLSVTSIAERLPNPKHLVGVHFFNPAPVMKLVEIVKTKFTDDAVIEMIEFVIKKMGKTPVICNDAPGFIVNRVARPFYIESLRIAEEGLADFETIDRLLENAGFKMGAFKLMDLIGNDINYTVSCSVYEQLNQPAHLQPSYIQQQKVEQGELGVKTGKGYYEYHDLKE